MRRPRRINAPSRVKYLAIVTTISAVGVVGLYAMSDDIEPLTDERAQGGHGEFRSSEERHAHLQLACRLRRYLFEIACLILARLFPFGEQQGALYGAQVVEK